MVRTIATKAEFDAALNEAASKGRTLIVDFTASWCGPCQRVAPIYEALAKEFPHVEFVKVDVDENGETAQEYQVSAMPTFKALRDKKEVGSLRGADPDGLRKLVMENAGSKFMGEGQRLGGSSTQGDAQSEREKRLAALERRGLGGGGAAPAEAAKIPEAPKKEEKHLHGHDHGHDHAHAHGDGCCAHEHGHEEKGHGHDHGHEPAAGAFTAQLQQLADMGFVDKATNQSLLEATGGDVQQVIMMLTEQ